MVSAVSQIVRAAGVIIHKSPRAMSKSLVFDEEEHAPDRPKEHAVNGDRIDSPLNNFSEQNQSSVKEHESDENVRESSSADEESPRYKETSESESSSESSSESEYSYDGSQDDRDDTSREPEERAHHPRPLSPPRKVSSEGEENNDESLSVLATVGTRVVSASPRIRSPQRKNGTRMIDLTNSNGAPLSVLALSPSRQSNALLKHALQLSPRSHVKHRQPTSSTSSVASQDSSSDGHVVRRRSSRSTQKPEAFTVTTFSPVQKRKRKTKRSGGSKVYGEETVDDLNDWETYGRIARKDDAKALRTRVHHGDNAQEEAAANEIVESMRLFSDRPRVYGEEEASLTGPLEPKSKQDWLNDSERHSEFLAAKRRRLNDSIDVLSDYFGAVKSRSHLSLIQRSPGRYQNREDKQMLDGVEDDMQFSLPLFVWSDHDACHKVFGDSKTLADREKEEYDKEGDAWCRNHFQLSTLPGVLSETELELAWLAQESIYCLDCPSWDWNYITIHASPALRCLLGQENPVLVRPAVSLEFQQARDLIRNALYEGYRRPHIREIIQRHLQLLYLRKQEEEDSD